MHIFTTVVFFIAILAMAALWAGHPFKRLDWERPRIAYMLAIVFISTSAKLAAMVYRDDGDFTWSLIAAIIIMGASAAMLFYAFCLILRAAVLACRVIKLKHRVRYSMQKHLPWYAALSLAAQDRADEWPNSSLVWFSVPRQ